MKRAYGNEQLRFGQKNLDHNERENFYGWFDEQIKLYGQRIEYFTYNVTLTGYDPV